MRYEIWNVRTHERLWSGLDLERACWLVGVLSSRGIPVVRKGVLL